MVFWPSSSCSLRTSGAAGRGVDLDSCPPGKPPVLLYGLMKMAFCLAHEVMGEVCEFWMELLSEQLEQRFLFRGQGLPGRRRGPH